MPDSADPAHLNLPSRVYAVITARLSRVSDAALDVMRMGATIGRAFSVEVLARASELDEEALLRSLDELWQRHIVRAQDPSASTYDFTHDKLREVAYAQLSPARRRLLHRRAAQAIEAVHAADLDSVSAQLAAQYEWAGMNAEAAAYYLQAGRVAQRVFASEEAVALLNRGLHLIDTLPSNQHYGEIELSMRSLRSIMAVGTLGIQTSDQFRDLILVRELSEKLGKQLDPANLRILAINYVVRDDFQQSRIIGDKLLETGLSSQDVTLIVEAHYVLGVSLLNVGELASAREQFERAIRLYEPQHTDVHLLRYGWDPFVVCKCRLAETLWCLGYLDQAQKAQDESLSAARRIKHPFSMGYSLFYDALLRMKLHNYSEACIAAANTIEFSRQHGLAWWLRYGFIVHGWAVAANGDLEGGIQEIEQGIEQLKTLGSHTNRPFLVSQLADMYGKRGETDRALQIIDHEIQILSDPFAQRWCLSDLLRISGDLLLAHPNHHQRRETAYRDALEIAKSQQAKIFELRAATSLARLWHAQGRTAEARALLQPVYDWFTEGFDTLDLRAAKDLLGQLTLP